MTQEPSQESPLPDDASVTDPAAHQPPGPAPGVGPETSGVDNWLGEGGPLEPGDTANGGDTSDPAGGTAAPVASEGEALAAAQRESAERLVDLQRLQAEYVNYKRRVDRDRELVKQNARVDVLTGMLPVLDDIDRAREHGELSGGFKAVADSLVRAVEGFGLVRFGAKGDEFDPNRHEALMHGLSPDVTTTTVDVVAQAGYQIGERVVRAAKVTVLDPEQ